MIELGFNVERFGEAIGLCKSGLSLKLNGKRKLTLNDVEKIAKVLKLNQRELIAIFFDKLGLQK